MLDTFGVSADADFEIGSISKGITGLLYADACDRGELGPDTALGELLPLAGSAVAGLKLGAVSRHSAGLPRLAPGGPGPSRLNRTVSFLLHGTNPYGESLGELLEQARAVRLGPPRPRYSNLGFELLGHAVAGACRDELPGPCYGPPECAAGTGLGLHAGHARRTCPRRPHRQRPVRPPEATLDGRSPGPCRRHPGIPPRHGPASAGRSWTARPRALSALDPVARFAGPARIGAAWITLEVKGRQITWHNGATGGFRQLDGPGPGSRHRRRGVSASSGAVDQHGFALLQELTARR